MSGRIRHDNVLIPGGKHKPRYRFPYPGNSWTESFRASLARISHQGGLWRRYTLYARTEPLNWT